MTKDIMICDNDRYSIDPLVDRLRSEGFEVEVTTHPEPCLARARDKDFDLFILDMDFGPNMPPGMKNGLELAQELWKLESAVDVPIVGITGVYPEWREKALDLGLINFLEKPHLVRQMPKLLAVLDSRDEAQQAMENWLAQTAGPHWNLVELRLGHQTVDLQSMQSTLVAGSGPLILPREECRLALRVLEQGMNDQEFFEGLGARLQQSLFPGAVNVAFHQQRLLSQLAQRPFRLLMHCEDSTSARLPWELCRYSGGTDSGHWLGGDPQLTCARVPHHGGRLLDDEDLPLPVKILVVGAQAPGTPELKLNQELEALREAMRPLDDRVEWKVLGLPLTPSEEASPATINEEINRFQPTIIHFMCHGVEGALLLEQQQALATWSDYFLNLDLAGQGVKLLMLNCCSSAQSGSTSPGLAEAGAKAGVRAVIGHFFPVSDPAAISFTRLFYSALARGDALDKALQGARRQVASEELRNHRTFLPVMWIRERFFRLAV